MAVTETPGVRGVFKGYYREEIGLFRTLQPHGIAGETAVAGRIRQRKLFCTASGICYQ